MTSSISSSDPPGAWARFLRRFAVSAAVLLAVVYGFVALVDPWGALPVSLPIERLPVTQNQRFAYPMLARDPRFDSAVIGTSTLRLLDPAQLDALLGGRFANLAMNDSTAWEQMRLLDVFLEAHATPRQVIIGLDRPWCEAGPLRRLTDRPFPEWIYARSRWRGYREVFNLYAIEEAGRQVATVAGWMRPRYGDAGYANFLPDDSRHDPARAHANLWPPQAPLPPAVPGRQFDFPQHALLAERLQRLPAGSRALLVLPPIHIGSQPPPETAEGQRWAQCKASIARLAAAAPQALVVDFMIPSPITREDAHYWDSLHYRLPVATTVMRALAGAARGEASADGLYRLPATEAQAFSIFQ